MPNAKLTGAAPTELNMATETQNENESEPGGRAASAVERLVMRTYSYEGIGSDGSTLEPGKIYMARFTGAPDESGEPRETPDDKFFEYKAVKSGRLFAMRRAPDFRWYHLPQYFEFA